MHALSICFHLNYTPGSPKTDAFAAWVINMFQGYQLKENIGRLNTIATIAAKGKIPQLHELDIRCLQPRLTMPAI